MTSALDRLREQFGDDAVRVALSANVPNAENLDELRRLLPPNDETGHASKYRTA
jgi:uncharacterized protein YqiB (DUF1249 family)